MDDGRLSELLGELDRVADPPAAFADALWATLGDVAEGPVEAAEAEPATLGRDHDRPPATLRRGLLVAAASFAGVLLLGVSVWLWPDDAQPPPFAGSSPPPAVVTAVTSAAPPPETAPPTTATPPTGAPTTSRPANVLAGLVSPGVDPWPEASTDWEVLDPGPFGTDHAAVSAWTGRELILWGKQLSFDTPVDHVGAAFDPASGSWRSLAPVPTEAQLGFDPVGHVWTGEELVIWDQIDAIAYDPDADRWRAIEEWPVFVRVSARTLYVWDGRDVLDLKGARAVSVVDGSVRRIAPADRLHERASAVWTGELAIVVTSNGMYDPASDTWLDMAASGLTPLSVAGVWTGDRLFAADYLMGAAEFDPAANEWTRFPEIPIRGGECGSAVYVVRSDVTVTSAATRVASICAAIAAWDETRDGWIPIQLPRRWESSVVGSDGQFLYVRDRPTGAFSRLRLDATPAGLGPSRIAVGIGAFDVPDGWWLVEATAQDQVHTFELQTIGDAVCTLSTGYALADSLAAFYLGEGGVVEEITREIDGTTIPVLLVEAGAIDARAHALVVQGTSDAVDVACADAATSLYLASLLWN